MTFGPLIIDYPVIITLIGTLIIGISSGILSCFAVLRKQSLLGDAIAHAILPGLCIAFLITLSKHTIILLIGGLISGWIGTVLIMIIVNQTHIKTDTALGIILSVFFGFGVFLLTIIQKIPTSRQAGLETYLFGSAASILKSDLIIMGCCLGVILIITTLCWKEFKCFTFDKDYCSTLGFPVQKIEILLTSILVITIVIGLQTVGVILMSALIIAPATAARQWTNQFGIMVIISIIFSILAGLLGVILSSSAQHIPTGPTIVIAISILVFFSLFFAPKHGLISHWIQNFINRKNLHKHTILSQFYLLAKSHEDPTHPHSINTLEIIGGKPTKTSLIQLKKEKLVKKHKNNQWGLTKKGARVAQQLFNKIE